MEDKDYGNYENAEMTFWDWAKFIVPRFIVVAAGFYLLWFNGNWKAIIYPKIQPNDFAGLWKVLFTPLNVALAGIGATIALLILIFMLGRMLFTPLDEINMLGIGYKTRAKKQQSVAVKEMNELRKIDVVRMSIINTLGEAEFGNRIFSTYNQGTDSFEIFDILIVLCDVIESAFAMHFDEIALSVGVVVVEDGVLDNTQLQNLPTDIRSIIDKCFRRNMAIKEKGQVLSVPLKMEEGDTTYWIIYMKNSHKIFSNADQLLVQNAWRMIKSEAKLIVLDIEALEEVSN